MKKKLAPNFRWIQSSPEIPLTKRMDLLIERIHSGRKLWPYNDAATVKECIKRGLIKRERKKYATHLGRNTLVPLVTPEIVEVRVPKPFSKRNMAMDEAGLKRRKSS